MYQQSADEANYSAPHEPLETIFTTCCFDRCDFCFACFFLIGCVQIQPGDLFSLICNQCVCFCLCSFSRLKGCCGVPEVSLKRRYSLQSLRDSHSPELGHSNFTATHCYIAYRGLPQRFQPRGEVGRGEGSIGSHRSCLSLLTGC